MFAKKFLCFFVFIPFLFGFFFVLLYNNDYKTKRGEKMKDLITKIKARQILDSRGTPTVEVDVFTQSGAFGRASVPSGASTGSKEAIELRDGNPNYYFGKSVLNAVKNVNTKIAKKIVGMNVFDQEKIDQAMIELDGTPNKAKLGANAILGVSLAVLKAGACSKKKDLFEYVGNKEFVLPMPMMNVINGGKHADNSLNIQEFMIMPVGAKSWSQALEWCAEVFHSLKGVLKADGYSTVVGDEGGFAPNFKKDEQAFEYIVKAVETAGFKPKKDFCIAIDVASSEMMNEAKKLKKQGYYFWKSKKLFSADELLAYYEDMIKKYPIVSIEDGFDENDWPAWQKFVKKLGKKIQIVGDDLFVTNPQILEKGIELKAANSILIKLNQIGTVSETLKTIARAKDAGFSTIVSHRSGETEDSYIADISTGSCAGQIKTGAPSRSDRVAKYNQLLRIEEKLGKRAKFASFK